jgi:hypothetical protein
VKDFSAPGLTWLIVTGWENGVELKACWRECCPTLAPKTKTA